MTSLARMRSSIASRGLSMSALGSSTCLAFFFASSNALISSLVASRRVAPSSRTSYDELPPLLVHAILAAEDIRFFEHDGVDLQAVFRAAWANYRAGSVVEGASTITQQVARNLLPEEIGTERTLRRKVREALLARAIERRWTKRDILAL